MGSYKTSSGERLDKKIIDRRVTQAKRKKVDSQCGEYGYNFCEVCGVSSGTYLDCSHDISVDKCQKEGKTELAYDVDNITIRCRSCHRKHDNTY